MPHLSPAISDFDVATLPCDLEPLAICAGTPDAADKIRRAAEVIRRVEPLACAAAEVLDSWRKGHHVHAGVIINGELRAALVNLMGTETPYTAEAPALEEPQCLPT